MIIFSALRKFYKRGYFFNFFRNTKITTTKNEFSPHSPMNGNPDGPRVERILFRTDTEQIIKNMPEMNLLIRTKKEKRQSNQNLIFEPVNYSAYSNGRRIF
jgi:hypothetical protein